MTTLANTYVDSGIFMDTIVSIEIVDPGDEARCAARVRRALDWFGFVERLCSRFDRASEVWEIADAPVGTSVPVTSVVYSAIEFALAIARATDGAFDPTVGATMQRNGFNHNFRTGEAVNTALADAAVNFRDVCLHPQTRSVSLKRPLLLDLGAVAKGFAMDLAAAELSVFRSFAINAGGDLLLRGQNAAGAAWRIGIRHPRDPESLIASLSVTDAAVCTSGDYERPRPTGEPGHHIVTPATGESVVEVASVTVIGQTAMLADALSTAAFVLGPERGLRLLEGLSVEGLILSPALDPTMTQGMARYLA